MKTLTVYKPNSHSLLDEMDGIMNSIFHDDSHLSVIHRMNVDIHEDEKSYYLVADLPGFSDKDVDIEVKDNLLVIQGEIKKADEKTDIKYLVRERKQQKFQRSFVLPKDASADKISASMKNGVLNLRIEKKPEAKPRKIQIQ